MSNYDSRLDTERHIQVVRGRISEFCSEMNRRALVHDESKLGGNEKPAFDRETPMLKHLTYGSDEYKAALARLGNALDHHYRHNSHHPQHYMDGIAGMDLYDLVEMFCDWAAAVERHNDGDIFTSLFHNKERFGISDQLWRVLRNTAHRRKGQELKQLGDNAFLPNDGRSA